MSNQCYFNGDFYQCAVATSPGQDPGSTPQNWRKIQIPKRFRFALKQLTFSEWLKLDGQNDKSMQERALAFQTDRNGLDDLARDEANANAWLESRRSYESWTPGTTRLLQPVPASVILEDATRLMGLDPAELDPREVAMGRVAFSNALQEVWEHYWWADLMVSRQQIFASDYDDNFGQGDYDAGHVVHSPRSDAYYLCLWPAGGPVIEAGTTLSFLLFNPGLPANASGYQVQSSDRDNQYGWLRYDARAPWTSNPWNYQCNGSYGKNNVTTWSPTLTPNLGDLVSHNGNWYQWGVDAGILPNNEPNPAMTYTQAAFEAGTLTAHPGWLLINPWFPTLPLDLQVPNDQTGKFTSTPSGYYGDIRAITREEYATTPNPHGYHTRSADDGSGVVLLDLNVTRPWIYARRATPVITGDPYDATVAYAAADLTDLVFDS